MNHFFGIFKNLRPETFETETRPETFETETRKNGSRDETETKSRNSITGYRAPPVRALHHCLVKRLCTTLEPHLNKLWSKSCFSK